MPALAQSGPGAGVLDRVGLHSQKPGHDGETVLHSVVHFFQQHRFFGKRAFEPGDQAFPLLVRLLARGDIGNEGHSQAPSLMYGDVAEANFDGKIRTVFAARYQGRVPGPWGRHEVDPRKPRGNQHAVPPRRPYSAGAVFHPARQSVPRWL